MLFAAMKTKEETLSATEFKAKCLRILDRLDERGIVITKRGRPIARVTAVSEDSSQKFYGALKGKIGIRGDILSTGIKWHAQS
jgi:prevent-host-death family protein